MVMQHKTARSEPQPPGPPVVPEAKRRAVDHHHRHHSMALPPGGPPTLSSSPMMANNEEAIKECKLLLGGIQCVLDEICALVSAVNTMRHRRRTAALLEGGNRNAQVREAAGSAVCQNEVSPKAFFSCVTREERHEGVVQTARMASSIHC